MSRLNDLYTVGGQSPWLDNLKREWLESGEIQSWIDRGVRGITSNPSIFQKAIEGSAAYDAELAQLLAAGASVEEAYWSLVQTDISAALALLRRVYDESEGLDGFVSVEVAPSLAHQTTETIDAAIALKDSIDEPNLYIKVPATSEGVQAVRRLIAQGCSVNVTLIFGLERYREVIEAYIAGLEEFARHHTGDLGRISSVASLFISRVDTEVDHRLDAIGTPEALELRGTAATTQAQLAYQLAMTSFSGERWERLQQRGARFQRPLWASTSTKNPAYPDTLYVDALIGPHTVNTMPDPTLSAFEDHGTVSQTIDSDVEAAQRRWDQLTELVDMDDVAKVLEMQGVDAFQKSYDDLVKVLADKAQTLRPH